MDHMLAHRTYKNKLFCHPFTPKLLRQAYKRVHSDTQSHILHILSSMALLTLFRITHITYLCSTPSAASCSFGFRRLMSTTSSHLRPFNTLHRRLCSPSSFEPDVNLLYTVKHCAWDMSVFCLIALVRFALEIRCHRAPSNSPCISLPNMALAGHRR